MMKTKSGKPSNVANLCRRRSFLRVLDHDRKLKRTPLSSQSNVSLIRAVAVNIGARVL
jgi:hypothetical protein